MAVFEVLDERGFIQDVSDPGLAELLAKEKVTVYAGFDPSADSLHLGHLIPILGLAHFQRQGHRPIALVGGATGMIGDPSGKDKEREFLSVERLRHNQERIREQLARFLSFEGENAALLVNNFDWIGPRSYLDFLRDVGKHFSVNAMIAKESVRARLENREQGISYTEFSYQLLQAYDFHWLAKEHGCRLQIGGSDQWGNITAGIDLTRRLQSRQVYGATFPLLMTAAGKKFGKSEGNSVWLDGGRTSPFEFYQYWLQTDDRDVARYLKLFTFLPMARIAELEKAVAERPEAREAQKVLAEAVTEVVHGVDGVSRAKAATEVLFGGKAIKGFGDEELRAVFKDAPSVDLPRVRVIAGISAVDVLAETGAAKSKGEARRLLKQGGFYWNNERMDDEERVYGADDLASESFFVLRKGKKTYTLVRLAD